MTGYRVIFDGRSQAKFASRERALAWARAVAETGRLVDVEKRALFGYRLLATFRKGEGKRLRRMAGGAAAAREGETFPPFDHGNRHRQTLTLTRAAGRARARCARSRSHR